MSMLLLNRFRLQQKLAELLLFCILFQFQWSNPPNRDTHQDWNFNIKTSLPSFSPHLKRPYLPSADRSSKTVELYSVLYVSKDFLQSWTGAVRCRSIISPIFLPLIHVKNSKIMINILKIKSYKSQIFRGVWLYKHQTTSDNCILKSRTENFFCIILKRW